MLFLLQDNNPEPNESFLVNITGVRIADEADRQGSSTDSPRVQPRGQTLQVVIEENDNNRGLLGFGVTAASVEEVFASQVTVQVVRTRGIFGAVSVQYNIEDVETNSADYTPLTQSPLVFQSGQQAANITIQIVDDQTPEPEESFRVVLGGAMGGAEVGTPSSVLVNILDNDDINGVFFFGDSSLLVSAVCVWREGEC